MARWASCNGPMDLSTIVSSLGSRYLSTKAATPCLFSAFAIFQPSLLIESQRKLKNANYQPKDRPKKFSGKVVLTT